MVKSTHYVVAAAPGQTQPAPPYEGGCAPPPLVSESLGFGHTAVSGDWVVIPPPFLAILEEPIPITYVVDSRMTNVLVKRRTSNPIICFQGTIVALGGRLLRRYRGGVPPGADGRLSRKKDPSLYEKKGGGCP